MAFKLDRVKHWAQEINSRFLLKVGFSMTCSQA